MERVKELKYVFLPLFISIIFFIIPFFWLKPGVMDLGGDSSRLYFYDPISYLFSQSLFSISQSGLGVENQSFYAIPLLLLLALFKTFVHSSTLLMSGFHGMSLSIAFFSCYLIVKSLCQDIEMDKNKLIIEFSAVLAGLFYNLSPVPILGWGYVILTYNQVFLNPLIFFLLLRFFITRNMRYMLVALLISFIFSPNFTYVGAPPFFAFYPLAFLFLFIYIKHIRHTSIPWKKLMIGVILFFLLQSFHLIPQIVNLLSPGSQIYQSVFSKEAKFNRGLGYFSAIAPSIKDSISLLSQSQLTKITLFSWLFIVFPFLFVFGFIWNKRKTYLLTGIFFLITLFFYSANITKIGFNLYVAAFKIPGFSMFRNFYGQWQWVYLFFYVILLGQALAIVLARIKKWKAYGIISFIFILLVATSWSFINGTLADTKHWGSKDVRTHIKMDPKYEDVLSYLRALPVDGKVLSFPLTDAGYQVLQGKEGGAYIGPSTITYLTNKNGFSGFAELGQFGQVFLDAAKEKNYQTIKDIFSFLNIKYIFYDSDEYIYGNNFPGSPYGYVRDFLPKNQDEYKLFIQHLGVEKLTDFGEKYHIYEIKNDAYLPKIYIAGKNIYWNNMLVNPNKPLSFYTQDKKIAVYDDRSLFKSLSKFNIIFDDIFLTAQDNNPISDFFKLRDPSPFASPYISQKLSSLIYPFVVLREKNNLVSIYSVNDIYFDRSVFYAEKRINELEKWNEEIPLRRNIKSIENLSKIWKEPKLWEIEKYKEYDSWEITLVRYQRIMDDLVKKINGQTESSYSQITNKVNLKNILSKHEIRLIRIIKQTNSLSQSEKKYLLKLSDDMYMYIYANLDLQVPDYSNIPYSIDGNILKGNYEVYVSSKELKNFDKTKLAVIADGKKLFVNNQTNEDWIRFDDVQLESKSSLMLTLSILQFPNLVENTIWKTLEQNQVGSDLVSLVADYSMLNNASGIIREIPGWKKDSTYAISFDYITYDRKFKIGLYGREGDKKDNNIVTAFEETLQSKDWKKFVIPYHSGQEANSSFFQITKELEDALDISSEIGNAKIEIKNLKVVQIPESEIILRKIMASKENNLSTPKITVVKINPTKYEVKVNNAQNPYSLVLLDQFSSSWKIFSPNNQNPSKMVRGAISVFFGNSAKMILGIFMKNQSAQSTSTFLEPSTFESWRQSPIAEDRHFSVNGYANSWYILPKDVKYKKDYTLIVEMTSQKLFYESICVSIIGLALTLLFLLRSFKK